MSGVAVATESARPPDKCVQRRSVSVGAGTAGATAGRTPTQNALVGWSGRFNSHRLSCLVAGGVNWTLTVWVSEVSSDENRRSSTETLTTVRNMFWLRYSNFTMIGRLLHLVER